MLDSQEWMWNGSHEEAVERNKFNKWQTALVHGRMNQGGAILGNGFNVVSS